MGIDAALAKAKAHKGSWQVSVIGVGGAGSKVVQLLASQRQYPQIQFMAINYDHTFLAAMDPLVETILIGKLSHNMGCFGHTVICQEELNIIGAAVKQPGVSVILLGLGGHCGSENGPLIAGHLSSLGLLTIAVATLPFNLERKGRMRAALAGLEKLKEAAAAVVVLLNQQILDTDPKSGQFTLEQAFQAAEAFKGSGLQNPEIKLRRPIKGSGLQNPEIKLIKMLNMLK